MRRVLLGSAALHALAMGVFAWTPQHRMSALPAVVTVDLVAAPAAPAPAARPKPKPPVKRKVVLPSEPQPVKPKPKPTPPPKAAPKPPPEPQKSYEDILEELKAKAGDEPPPEPMETARATPTAGATAGGTRGVRVSPEVMAWLRRARIHARQNWVLPPGFRTEDLEAHVTVRLDASGRMVGKPKLTRRSGNPWYDDTVMRAVEKSTPFPPPPEPGEWPFIFRPEGIS